MTDYYGVDWAATVAQVVSTLLLTYKKRSGWVWKNVATVLWLGFNLLVGSIPAVMMSVVYLWMNYRAWKKWE